MSARRAIVPERIKGLQWDTAINLITIILSITLALLILLQSKGSTFSGAFGGDTSGIYHTRRGMEKLLYECTIGVGILFLIFAIISSVVLTK
jgi:preprotein translocase subunit SecG